MSKNGKKNSNNGGNTAAQDEATKAKAKAEAAERAKAARAKGRAEAKNAAPVTRVRNAVNSFIKKLTRVQASISQFRANDAARVAYAKVGEAIGAIKASVIELETIPKDIEAQEPKKPGQEFEEGGFVTIREKARKHYAWLFKTPGQMDRLKITAVNAEAKKLVVGDGAASTMLPMLHVQAVSEADPTVSKTPAGIMPVSQAPASA